MAINYDDSLLTGIRDIDIQHKLLFDAINSLEDLEEKESTEDLWFVVCNIEEYASVHFKTEEEYMFKFRYPETDEHVDQHREFLEKYNVIKQEYEEKGLTKEYFQNLKNFLKEWIIEHYSNVDLKMAMFIRNYMEE